MQQGDDCLTACTMCAYVESGDVCTASTHQWDVSTWVQLTSSFSLAQMRRLRPASPPRCCCCCQRDGPPAAAAAATAAAPGVAAATFGPSPTSASPTSGPAVTVANGEAGAPAPPPCACASVPTTLPPPSPLLDTEPPAAFFAAAASIMAALRSIALIVALPLPCDIETAGTMPEPPPEDMVGARRWPDRPVIPVTLRDESLTPIHGGRSCSLLPALLGGLVAPERDGGVPAVDGASAGVVAGAGEAEGLGDALSMAVAVEVKEERGADADGGAVALACRRAQGVEAAVDAPVAVPSVEVVARWVVIPAGVDDWWRGLSGAMSAAGGRRVRCCSRAASFALRSVARSGGRISSRTSAAAGCDHSRM